MLSQGNVDYAHRSTGFPTWHRLYLLWFEREIQHVYEDFELFYWDWTDFSLLEKLFTKTHLGISDINGTVTGDIFDDWRTYCWKKDSHDYNICNPIEPDIDPCDENLMLFRKLHRCPTPKMSKDSETSSIKNVCEDETRWPKLKAVEDILDIDIYDAPDYRFAPNSFRNNMEGFESGDHLETTCADDRMCMCGKDYKCTCAMTDAGCNGDKAPLRLKLHNFVSIIIYNCKQYEPRLLLVNSI